MYLPTQCSKYDTRSSKPMTVIRRMARLLSFGAGPAVLPTSVFLPLACIVVLARRCCRVVAASMTTYFAYASACTLPSAMSCKVRMHIWQHQLQRNHWNPAKINFRGSCDAINPSATQSWAASQVSPNRSHIAPAAAAPCPCISSLPSLGARSADAAPAGCHLVPSLRCYLHAL
jgi:hypothetical protein